MLNTCPSDKTWITMITPFPHCIPNTVELSEVLLSNQLQVCLVTSLIQWNPKMQTLLGTLEKVS